MVKPCWRVGASLERSKINPTKIDGLTWYKDLGLHTFGEFSMAMIQANSVMEDQCQIESGPLTFNNTTVQGTFVGVYDGHGGPEASRFIADNIFPKLKKFATEGREISEQVISKTFAETDKDFLNAVKKQWPTNPQMASVGSCCLAGVICNGLVYIANTGDSRAVLGRSERGGVRAVQLSVEHNANLESARQELWSMHPNDPNILVMKHSMWRVKGVIQVTKSIGDAYLKKAEFNREPLLPKFRLPEHFTKPILSADPSVTVTRLTPKDEFMILASDGLWEHLSNQEAVDIVHNAPRQGIARRLLKTALKEAAKKREMRYADLKEIHPGVRRHFHDDITVIVIYLNPNPIKTNAWASPLSIRGGYPMHSSS
ncbi:PREDICTED: probable protein phosphatase 2C 67 isoform X2 [Camelina sativa]|uniref:protein-serine/threonine phosphatase n=1 Tax=Camelina sativa TaxID=90675 RepID=A0ABM0TBR1_CAMSA|nr:PREDICTED: probable protein phosphatase 2C 67 isoform X2 [Camelina sativa]